RWVRAIAAADNRRPIQSCCAGVPYEGWRGRACRRSGQPGGAMQLRADDFGCVPDGRVLESVRVLAGSTRLDVLDGVVRPGDGGKRIAVPGAVDLVTTIATLVRRKDCTGTMEAGSDELNAVLPPHADQFSQRAHRGLRITVEGAGPAGTTLITDV